MPHLQHIDQDHRVGNMAVELLLFGCVRQVDECPGHDARSPVEEELEVKPFPNAGVELNAHHEVVEDITGEFAAEIAQV